MNALTFIYVLLFTMPLATILFASSVREFFTEDELNEMGIHIGRSEMGEEEAAA